MDLADKCRTNAAFKRVVTTIGVTQYTVMHLEPGADIGSEKHGRYDQNTVVVSGHGYAELDGVRIGLGCGSFVPIKGGVRHNIVNTDRREPLKLIVTYTPPKFPDGAVYQTREEAENAEQSY